MDANAADAEFASHVSARRRMQKRCKAIIRYFSLVQIGMQRGYIALGKHSVFLLKEEDLQLKVLNEIAYGSIAQVTVDLNDKTVFSIAYSTESVIAGSIPLPTFGSVEVLQTSVRAEVLQELEVYWKADRLFQLRRVMEFPLVMGFVPRQTAASITARINAVLPKCLEGYLSAPVFV
jgi:hypothetical protein